MFLFMFFGMLFIHVFVMPWVMIASPSDYRISPNLIYGGVFMATCMVALEGLRHPIGLLGWIAVAALLTISTLCIRWQIGVSDDGFLRDMIPHHSMAVLTSRVRVARSTNPVVREFARQILQTQTEEISVMKRALGKTLGTSNNLRFYS